MAQHSNLLFIQFTDLKNVTVKTVTAWSHILRAQHIRAKWLSKPMTKDEARGRKLSRMQRLDQYIPIPNVRVSKCEICKPITCNNSNTKIATQSLASYLHVMTLLRAHTMTKTPKYHVKMDKCSTNKQRKLLNGFRVR